MVSITHKEISAVTAGRLGKGHTPESVSSTVREYGNVVLDLMKEKKPTNSKDTTIVETPLIGFKVNYHENGSKKNPDGTETKIGPHYSVNAAVPKSLIQGLNAEVLQNLHKTVTNASGVIGAVVKAIKSS